MQAPLADFPDIADFKEEGDLASAVPGVYLLFGADGLPAYVGQSSDIRTRLGQHRRAGKIEFHECRFYQLEDKVSRLRMEGMLILGWLPLENRMLALGLNGKTKDVWELRYSSFRKDAGRTSGGN